MTAFVPLTGCQYELAAGDYRATITSLGAGLRNLYYENRPLVHGYDADELPPAAAGQLLVPWPNRIDHGRYVFMGRDEQLAISEPDRLTAIHGLTRWAHWAREASGQAMVRLRCEPHGQQGYPFSVAFEAEYRLDGRDGLHVTLTARNEGSRPAPYGNGAHPYLTASAAIIDGCELTLPAARRLPLDQRGIPAGRPVRVDGTPYDFRSPRRIGQTVLDDAFTGLIRDRDGRAWARLSSATFAVSLWAGPGYPWLQVFTADPLSPDRRRKSVAIEPMTCPPNAFVTGDDVLVLQPGEEVAHTWGITAAR